ncbi:hypothetical protein KY284_030303 [Solanum tuberosum]|nr:hypothetical protein KY284_030303 [Solanum tuberosum]
MEWKKQYAEVVRNHIGLVLLLDLMVKFSNLGQMHMDQQGATAPTTWSKPIEEGSQSKQKKSTLFAEFKEFEGTSVCIAEKSELDLYLEEKNLDYQTFHEMDVIKYWKDNEKKYPNLSVMARDVLSVSITTVASESTFSIGDEDELLKEIISHADSKVIYGTSSSGIVKLC